MLRIARSLLPALSSLTLVCLVVGCAATWPVVETEKKSEDEMWANTAEEGLSGDVKKLVQKGQALYEAGQFDGGVEAFKLASELDPNNVSVLASLAYGESKTEDYVDAVYALERAVEIQPDDKSLKSSYAYNLGMAGQIEKSEKVYKELAAANPNDAKIYKNLAVAYAKNQRLPQAVMAYEKALELNPDDWETWTVVGKVCRDANPPVLLPAIAAFEHIRNGHPDDEERMTAVHSLGWLYVQTNTDCRAAEMYKMVDEYSPLNKDDRSNYAYALDKCGNVENAIEQYYQVWRADTTDVKVLCRLAFLYKDDNQFEKSAEIAKQGLAVNPDQACLQCAWGKALEKLGKYEEAISKFELALNDSYWGSYASKQIDRQNKLIKIREMRKLQEEYNEDVGEE
jgi:tetratricopeptide (TPR) repeat protein